MCYRRGSLPFTTEGKVKSTMIKSGWSSLISRRRVSLSSMPMNSTDVLVGPSITIPCFSVTSLGSPVMVIGTSGSPAFRTASAAARPTLRRALCCRTARFVHCEADFSSAAVDHYGRARLRGCPRHQSESTSESGWSESWSSRGMAREHGRTRDSLLRDSKRSHSNKLLMTLVPTKAIKLASMRSHKSIGKEHRRRTRKVKNSNKTGCIRQSSCNRRRCEKTNNR